jgi:quercetin dioxygenase-like cupin family protein
MQVLVVCPDDYDRAMFGLVAGHEFHFLPETPNHWQPDPAFDPVAYFERALAYAREHAVDAVLSTHDLGDLIAALVARELGLTGPDPEAVFLGLHKFYGRQREASPVRCEAIPLFGPVPSISYPAFFKAPCLKLGLLAYKLEDHNHLQAALANARREYPAWARQYHPLFERAIDVKRYPLAVQNVMLVEEFVEGCQATVEGWVHNGRPSIAAIVDTNNRPESTVIDSFSLPSRLSYDVQQAMKAHAVEAVRRLGFDNGFFNVELWHTSRGIVTTEVNGRAAVCFNELYELAMGWSIFAAVTELACGRSPVAPPAPQRVAGQFNLTTLAEGDADALMDYTAASDVPGLSILRPRHSQIRQTSQFGVVLAQLEISGRTYDEIHGRAEQVRRRLLREPFSPAAVSAAGAHAFTEAPTTGIAELSRISRDAAGRLCGGKWSPESIKEIADELSTISLNQADEAVFEQLRVAPSDDPWREIEILDQPGMHSSLFYLPQGAVIPLHDHPSMTVISKVLQGRLRVRTLAWLDLEQGLARDEGEDEVAADGRAIVMEPRPGVLHEITALTECVFLDLFSPYYAEEEGRDCSYYEAESALDCTLKLRRRDRAGTLVS